MKLNKVFMILLLVLIVLPMTADKARVLLSISISGPSSVAENSSANYTVTARYTCNCGQEECDGYFQDSTNWATFSSSNTSVASFEGQGLLITENISSCSCCVPYINITITAGFAGKTRSKSVKVLNTSGCSCQ